MLWAQRRPNSAPGEGDANKPCPLEVKLKLKSVRRHCGALVNTDVRAHAREASI